MGTRKLEFERVDIGHETGDGERVKEGCRNVKE